LSIGVAETLTQAVRSAAHVARVKLRDLTRQDVYVMSTSKRDDLETLRMGANNV
jgi:hypothetical protein